MTVIISVDSNDWLDELSITAMQTNAEVSRSKETAASLCGKLWTSHRIDYSAYAGHMNELRGCAVRD
jgi:hypothetical protein